MFWIYMLECADRSYYVGHTDNLDLRIAQHQGGECGHTAPRRPLRVVFVDEFPSRDEAILRERQIKGWTRSKKQALIGRNWERLHQLVRAEWLSEGLPRAMGHPSTALRMSGAPSSLDPISFDCAQDERGALFIRSDQLRPES